MAEFSDMMGMTGQPPTSPEELAQRTQGWMGVLDTVRTNPHIAQALLFAGARMLQGQRPGQSFGGALGEAAMGGVAMYGQLEQSVQDRAAKEAEAKSIQGVRTAQVEESRQRTEESRQKAPLEMDRLRAQTREANLKLQIAEIDAQVKAGIPVSEQVRNARDMMAAELERTKAQSAASRASAGASAASAAESAERRQWIKPQALARVAQDLGQTAGSLATAAEKASGAGGKEGVKWAQLDHKVKIDLLKTQADMAIMNPEVADMTPEEFYTNVYLRTSPGPGQGPARRVPAPTGNRVLDYRAVTGK